MIKLYLYKKEQKRNIDDSRAQLYKATGLNSSYLPHGFEVFAGFSLGDVYIDEELKNNLDDNLKKEIDSCLDKFLKDDYGVISSEEKESNIENKYFGGGELVGRYIIGIWSIQVVFTGRNTNVLSSNNNDVTGM